MRKKAAQQRRERLFQTELPPLAKSLRGGEVVFLRAENYMKKCHTRQEMVFYDHSHQPVKVIHAFAVRTSAIKEFLENARRLGLKFKRVYPPKGWRVYALRWYDVQRFVGVIRNGFFDLIGDWSDIPPQVLRFRPCRHTIVLDWDYIPCWCGCGRGWWEIKPIIAYQVVFAERPISYIKGKEVKEI